MAAGLGVTNRCFKRGRGWCVGGLGGDAPSTNLLQASAAAYASTIADVFDPGEAEEADTSDASAKCAALLSCAAEDGAAATNIIKYSCY